MSSWVAEGLEKRSTVRAKETKFLASSLTPVHDSRFTLKRPFLMSSHMNVLARLGSLVDNTLGDDDEDGG
jgi:hypothetical protein